MRSRWGRLAPVLAWLPEYDRAWLTRDIIAGFVVWAILVPEGMAYAQVAGLPQTAVFYAAPAALLGYALFGPSRQLVVAVSGAAAALSAAAVHPIVQATGADIVEVSAALAAMAGLASIAFGFLRFGFVSNFLSRPVAVGFIFGLAAKIALKQLPKLIGVEARGEQFFPFLLQLIRKLPEANVPTVAMGLGCLLTLGFLRWRFPRVPAPLVVLALSIAMVALFQLQSRGVAIAGAQEGGVKPPSLPILPLALLRDLVPGALGLALVVYAEGLGVADTLASRRGDRLRPNQELFAFGTSNLLSGLFQGFPIGVSLSKTAANEDAGAHSQLSGAVAAALTVITAWALTGIFTWLPDTALAAIVLFAIRGMFDFRALKSFARLSQAEFQISLLSILFVLLFPTLTALFFAVVTSVLLLFFLSSRPRVTVLGYSEFEGRFADIARNPDAVPHLGVLAVRVEGFLWHANAQLVMDRIQELEDRADHPVRAIVLDLEETPQVDITTLERLAQFAHRAHREGRFVLLARVRALAEEQLRKGGVLVHFDGAAPTVEVAVEWAAAMKSHAPPPPEAS